MIVTSYSGSTRKGPSSIARATLLLTLVACMVLVAACSTPSHPLIRKTKETKPPATAATTSPPTTAPAFEVTARIIAGLGTVLVDAQGDSTLYIFEPDRMSDRSTCYGECANLWPPLLLLDGESPIAGAGLNPSLLGSTVRSDGLKQITYNGWPLYLWQGDMQAGRASGQGLHNSGGLWFVLSPNGTPITAKP